MREVIPLSNPARRQRVDVRGFHLGMAVAAEAIRLHLIHAEDEEVGTVWFHEVLAKVMSAACSSLMLSCG